MTRSTLTASTLERLRKDTKLDWRDSSCHNDICDSVLLELANGYSIQVWIPNSTVEDPGNEKFARYAYCMRESKTGEELTDNIYPTFGTYEQMRDSLQVLLAYHFSLYPDLG